MNKRYHSLAWLMTLCFLLLLVSGCGSSGNKEGDTAATTTVGDRTCVQCHSATKEALTGQTIVAQYQNSSPHNTAALGCESCHGSGGRHQGVGPIEYAAPDAARCASCHNGTTAPATNSATKFSDSSHANMTIEEGSACRRCHSHEGALLGNVGGLTGINAVMANVANQGAVPFTSTYSKFKCSTCHDHGGGLRTVMARDTAAGTATTAAMGAMVNWNPDRNQTPGQFDLCTSCHTMYDFTGNTLLGAGTAANAATNKPAMGLAGYHGTSWYRVISTTHYDNPLTGLTATDTTLGTGNIIEGYVLRQATAANPDRKPCFDCHGHEAKAGTRYGRTTTPTIYTDWAQSGHAGKILAAKYAAVDIRTTAAAAVDSAMISGGASTSFSVGDSSTDYAHVDAAGVANTITRVTKNADAWAHYQWERTLKVDGTSDRGACQKCHTATGASNFLTDPATYDYKENDFTHMSGWRKATATAATIPSPQQEVLYCWGCHTNAGTGAVRNPVATGKVTGMPSEYKFEGGTVAGTFPDVAASNVCIGCHSGRSGGMNVKALTTFTNATTAISVTNSHYLPAAGVLFKAIGYEYAGTGRSYADNTSFRHATVGTAAQPNTGTSGPCVSCHMGPISPADHKWQLAGFQGGTCGTSAAGVAGACHATMTRTEIDEEKESYEDALFALSALLKFKGIAWAPTNPYMSSKDWTLGGTVDGKNMIGAGFNLNMLLHEPGGFTHNRYYVKRLIFDSIDFAYNGALETLTIAAAGTYYEGSDVQAAINAMVGKTYADHAGVVQTYTAAQAAKAIIYLDRRPDATYPTYPGMQRP